MIFSYLSSSVQVSAVCLASYTAAFVTLIAATLLSAEIQRCLLLTTSLETVSSATTTCVPIPESWHVVLPELSGLPLWQTQIENVTEHIERSDNLNDYLNASTTNSSPAQNLDDAWQQIISYLTSASTHAWALTQAKREIPLIQLKGVM